MLLYIFSFLSIGYCLTLFLSYLPYLVFLILHYLLSSYLISYLKPGCNKPIEASITFLNFDTFDVSARFARFFLISNIDGNISCGLHKKTFKSGKRWKIDFNGRALPSEKCTILIGNNIQLQSF